ncbi:hypothetical protein Tco_1485660 [Tanacetum coccineum]|uniref:Uncharacterized protein n=1 Tax=Tanacetum coccineum TaxID=301880 RepID=A0ABQ5CYM5_9ASTR
MDGTNLARIKAESGTWIELDTSVPLMDGQAWERTVSIYGSDQQVENSFDGDKDGGDENAGNERMVEI